MALVFILLGIVIAIALFTTLLISSTINIQVKNFASSNIQKLENQNAKVTISLKAFGKLTWLLVSFNPKRLKKMKQKMSEQKINMKKLRTQFQFSDLKAIKKLQIKMVQLNLALKLGTGNAEITAYLIGTLASMIAIVLPYVTIKRKQKDYNYQLKPLYWNQNVYEIQLNCIIQVKMVHIINTIYFLVKKKKRRSDLYERASNRRSYDYSHG